MSDYQSQPAPSLKAEAEEHIIGESKADAFKRLGRKRVNAALDRIRLIGNLANRSSYEFTDEQVDAIENALVSATTETINKFRKTSRPSKPTFEF